MSNMNSSIVSSSRGSTSVQQPFRQRLVYTPVYQKLSLMTYYVISYYKGRQNRQLYNQLKTYCLFTGHARSGHSIVGALIDAHPNSVIADEVDTLKYVAAGFNRDQICYMLMSKAHQIHSRKGRLKPGRDGKTYSYAVPGQWQGRFDKLYVIGDTRAGGSTIRIGQDPTILKKLQEIMPGINLKIINVIRNPYDNISTKMVRRGMSFEQSISDYFRNCAIIADIYKYLDSSQFLMIRQEDVINKPHDTIGNICQFLGLDAPNDYLDACAGILYKSPAKSRHKVDWTLELIDSVQKKIEQIDFLDGYTYES